MAKVGVEVQFCPFYNVGFCNRKPSKEICTIEGVMVYYGKVEKLPCETEPRLLGELKFSSSNTN